MIERDIKLRRSRQARNPNAKRLRKMVGVNNAIKSFVSGVVFIAGGGVDVGGGVDGGGVSVGRWCWCCSGGGGVDGSGVGGSVVVQVLVMVLVIVLEMMMVVAVVGYNETRGSGRRRETIT